MNSKDPRSAGMVRIDGDLGFSASIGQKVPEVKAQIPGARFGASGSDEDDGQEGGSDAEPLVAGQPFLQDEAGQQDRRRWIQGG